MLARVRFSPIAGGCIDLESLKCAVRNNFAAFEFLFVCLFFLQMHIGMCLNYIQCSYWSPGRIILYELHTSEHADLKTKTNSHS